MKTISILFVLFISSSAFATEQWFCTDESGKRDGDTVLACGVGESTTEDYARKRALTSAIYEFQTICDMSSECAGRPTSVEPKRLTCSQDKQGLWKCYRLIAVTLGKR